MGKRFCIHGHDTEIVGRETGGNCKGCRAERKLRGRPMARMCGNGHDTSVVGRYASGTCRECQKLYNRNTRREQKEHGVVNTRRLRRLAGSQAFATQAYMVARGVTKRSAERQSHELFTEKWISLYTADVWCIVLGEHLSWVYPELYTASKKVVA